MARRPRRIPNAETLAAIEEARHPELLRGYATVEELWAALKAEWDEEDRAEEAARLLNDDMRVRKRCAR
jgi:hypothetical protein